MINHHNNYSTWYELSNQKASGTQSYVLATLNYPDTEGTLEFQTTLVTLINGN